MKPPIRATLKRLNAITDRENLIEELAKETGRSAREVEKHLNQVWLERLTFWVMGGWATLWPALAWLTKGGQGFADIHHFFGLWITWITAVIWFPVAVFLRRFFDF